MHDATYKFSAQNLPRPSPPEHVSILFSWGEEVRALALREGQRVIVGRAEPAVVIIEDRSLSRTHARLSVSDGELTLEDLDSTNGCSVNGACTRRAVLTEADVAHLGSVEVRIASRSRAVRPASRSLSHAEFIRQLAEELERARVFARPLSVVALRHAQELECAAIPLALRSVDRACRFAPGLFLVLLTEMDRVAASAWVHSLLREQNSPWAAGLACYPALACAAEPLVSSALDAAHEAKLGGLAHAAPEAPPGADAPILRSPSMRRLYELVARAARTTLPVLVLGETGSGKELVARAVHEQSPRAKAPFKALNCATIPTNLVESLLFGHERGAFTGADKQSQGIFEQAHKGSVFLDELGELSPQVQAALLRVLELGRIVRVGGTREIEVDVRVVAATHRDLAAMVRSGTFREDLMFRLDALSLRVPPLRERPEEIVPLAELFLQRACTRWDAGVRRLSEDAVDALMTYTWPGNVRQLKNVIERAVAVCGGETVELEDLPEQVWAEATVAPAGAPSLSPPASAGGLRSLTDRVREFEVGLIREAMIRAHGNQSHAARMLGIARRTLANKVHAYGLLDQDMLSED